MNARKIAEKLLEENGYTLQRHGANHDIYRNATLRCSIPLKRHDIDEDDLRYIQNVARPGHASVAGIGL